MFRVLLLLIIPRTIKIQCISSRQPEFRGISREEEQELLNEYRNSGLPE